MSGGITDTDGVSWHEAPLPRRWHRCRPHSYGWVNNIWVDRCACGAIHLDGHNGGRPWLDKNSRRKGLR